MLVRVAQLKSFLVLSAILVFFVGCSSSDNPTPTSSSTGGGYVLPPMVDEVMINGYFASWNSSSFFSTSDYSNLTIAYFAFVVCDANGNLITSGNESKMTALITAAHAANTKAYLSFGGGGYYGSTTFYNMANDSTSRRAFAHNVKEFCLTMGFDGFDVDWEGLANAQQGAAHEALMTTLKDTLHAANLGLAVTVQQGGSASFFTYNGMNQADLVQIMAYDATGTWSGSPVGQHSSFEYAANGIDYWMKKGVPLNKQVLGVPFYGYRFASMPCPCQAIMYKSIVANYPTLSDDDDYLDSGVYSETYFNGFSTISQKVSYARQARTLGIMIWEMSQDASGSQSLLKRTADYLVANNLSVRKLSSSIP